MPVLCLFFFFQAEDGIRDVAVTGVQTCALPICAREGSRPARQIDVARVLQVTGRLLLAAEGPCEISAMRPGGIAQQRRGPKQNAGHDREHGDVRPHAERQRQHDAEREAGALRERAQRVAEILEKGVHHVTTHPSRSCTIRLPNCAFTSECVTCTIVVPPRFSSVNSSMISFPWLEWRLPVGSSARMSEGL